MHPDVIGHVYDETDPENPILQPGWHVNSIEPIPGAEDFLVFPVQPKREFLGVNDCHRYRFESKEQFEQYFPNAEVDT